MMPVESDSPPLIRTLDQYDVRLSFGRSEIGPGAKARLAVRAPRPIEARDLVYTGACGGIVVWDLLIGGRSKRADYKPSSSTLRPFVPETVVPECAWLERKDCIRIGAKTEAVLVVENISNEPVAFAAALIGELAGEKDAGRDEPAELRVLERNVLLPFGPRQLGPGEEECVTAHPQVAWRGCRLAYAGPADTFAIRGIKIGRNYQWASVSGGVPMELFPPVGVGGSMRENNSGINDVARPGHDVSLLVQNKSNAPAEFAAVIYGDVVE